MFTRTRMRAVSHGLSIDFFVGPNKAKVTARALRICVGFVVFFPFAWPSNSTQHSTIFVWVVKPSTRMKYMGQLDVPSFHVVYRRAANKTLVYVHSESTTTQVE